jgi:hypothetical protein
MPRLRVPLRIAAIVVASPVLLLCVVLACLFHPVQLFRHPVQIPLRSWMNLGDWVRGIPVGYSYWERYQAPAMLDEVAVHHHEDSGA